jgi:hypothetical protein
MTASRVVRPCLKIEGVRERGSEGASKRVVWRDATLLDWLRARSGPGLACARALGRRSEEHEGDTERVECHLLLLCKRSGRGPAQGCGRNGRRLGR